MRDSSAHFPPTGDLVFSPTVMGHYPRTAAQQQASQQLQPRTEQAPTFQPDSELERPTRRVRFTSNGRFSNERRQQQEEARNSSTAGVVLFPSSLFVFGTSDMGNGAHEQAQNNGAIVFGNAGNSADQQPREVQSSSSAFVFGRAGNSTEQQAQEQVETRNNNPAVQQHPGVFVLGNSVNVAEQQQARQQSANRLAENRRQLAEQERTRAQNLWRELMEQRQRRDYGSTDSVVLRERVRTHNLVSQADEQRNALPMGTTRRSRQGISETRPIFRERVHQQRGTILQRREELDRPRQELEARQEGRLQPLVSFLNDGETPVAEQTTRNSSQTSAAGRGTASARANLTSPNLSQRVASAISARRSAISALSRNTATAESSGETIAARRAAITALTEGAGSTTTTIPSTQVECPSQEEVSHDRPASEGAPACVICQENVPLCIALPCLHMSYCVECARSLCLHRETGTPKRKGRVNCAKCREPLHAVSRVFVER